MTKRAGRDDVADTINAAQRRFALAYVGPANGVAWKAAQAAGYCNSDPQADYSEDGKMRRELSKAGSRALASPTVAAEIDRLRKQALGAALTQPEVKELRDRVREGLVVERDAVAFKQELLEELTNLAFSDVGDIATWGENGKDWKVRGRDEMSPAQRRQILELEFNGCTAPCCAGTGARSYARVKLHPKVPALTQLAKHVGIGVTAKVELSGKDGGPIAIAAGQPVGLTRDTVLHVRRLIVGRPVAPVPAGPGALHS